MRGNIDEKEKCLEKLNEMQTFLPFLDFMIDKIKRKSALPLECQLSKFQHIRSVIIEKNAKYSLEGLANIEDILQKLIFKLDYKVKTDDNIHYANCVKNLGKVAESSEGEGDSGLPTLRTKPGGVEGIQEADDVKTIETKTTEKYVPSELLASSRKKLLSSVSRKPLKDPEKQLGKKDSTRDSDNSCKQEVVDGGSCEKKSADHKLINSERNSIFENISDDEDVLDNMNKVDQADLNNSAVTSENHFDDVSSSSGDVVFVMECKSSVEFLATPQSYPLNECNSKQKLRERLSADIAEVHKVPGKSVGGSLRSLKDIKSPSEEKEFQPLTKSERSYGRKKTTLKDKNRRRHSETSSDAGASKGISSERHVNKSDKKKHKKKDREKKTREQRKDDDSHPFERSGRHVKGSSSSKDVHAKFDGKLHRLVEKKERKKKRLEIDKLSDEELAEFVKENMSSFPHLSKMEPSEMRKVARSSLIPENADSDLNLCEGKGIAQDTCLGEKNFYSKDSEEIKENVGNEVEEGKSQLQSNAEQVTSSKQLDKVPENVSDLEDSEDEYAKNLIDVTTPSCNRVSSDLTDSDSRKYDLSPKLHQKESSVAEAKDIGLKLALTPTNTQEIKRKIDVHSLNECKTSYWTPPQTQKMYTDCQISSRPPHAYNERIGCDTWTFKNVNNSDKSFQSRPHYLAAGGNRLSTFGAEPLTGNDPRPRHGLPFDVLRSPGHNRYSGYQVSSAKSYAEYKQLKRQELESTNKSILSPEEKIETEALYPVGDSSQSVRGSKFPLSSVTKQTDSKVREPLKFSSLCKTANEDKSIKARAPQTTALKGGNEETRRSVEEDKIQENKAEGDEFISPLNRLYENEPKPVTGRGYGLQHFKIPKKGRSATKENARSNSDNVNETQPKQSASDHEKSSNSSVLGNSCLAVNKEDGKDELDFSLGNCDVNHGSEKRLDKIVDKHKQHIVKDKLFSEEVNEKPVDKENENKDQNVNASSSCEILFKGSDFKKLDNIETVHEKIEDESAKVTDENKGSIEKILSTTNESQNKNFDSNVDKSLMPSKEGETRHKEDSEAGSKALITEEITQELVEALISKSFQSGEGELLLAKAKLFKELALKLNSKKLKTIQKIINSESDSSLSSSDSSDFERKKRRVRRRRISDGSNDKKEKEKKIFKSKEFVDSSGESDKSNQKADDPVRIIVRNIAEKETDSKEDTEDTDSQMVHRAGEVENSKASPCKDKKSQRKTKLLEQIFKESPAQDFDIGGMATQGASEKESDQKKPKLKGKGKTELDRLHEDIRSMFICSGVVTATGQRMCRMLRETGGKMNNLDLVKESAKMVEEEKLKSHRTNKKTNVGNKRSRSRSVEKKRPRYRPVSNELANPDNGKNVDLNAQDMDLFKNQPCVLLEKINLKKFSYAYRIRGFPESFNRRGGRNVGKRSGKKPRSLGDEETVLNRMSRIYLCRNVRKSILMKSKSAEKKCYRGKKLSDIIQKLPLKMAKIKHLEIRDKELQQVTTARRMEKPSELSTKLQERRIVPKDSKILDYSFDKRKTVFQCLLCPLRTKTITAHYKSKHPDSEVLISRLGRVEARRAIDDSIANNYDVTTLEQACSLELIRKRVKSKLTENILYQCRMCNYNNVNICHFYNHISTHTGEYRYKCPVEDCAVTMANKDNLKGHIASKHAKNKSFIGKAVELFPLPTEYGNFFGYLCSRCNFVQVFRKNVETHVQNAHGEDVRIIRIDLSGKPGKEQDEVKRKRQQGKGKKMGSGSSSDGEDDNEDDAGDLDFEDVGDEDYSYNSNDENVSNTSSGGGDDEYFDDEYKPKNISTRSTAEEKTEVKEDDGTLPLGEDSASINDVKTSKIPELISINDLNEFKRDGIKRGSSSAAVEIKEFSEKKLENLEIETTEIKRSWKIGPLETVMLTNGSVQYKCFVTDCQFTTFVFAALNTHILKNHPTLKWEEECPLCNEVPSNKIDLLKDNSTLVQVLEHLQNHVEMELHNVMVNKKPDDQEVYKKPVNESDATDPSKPEVSIKEEIIDVDNPPYPPKPLLRVRSFMGDRLSKPKEEILSAESSFEGEKVKADDSCLFKIKDVRSLNSEINDESANVENAFENQEQGEKFPPNAKVISGKPVLIRSCPSPKIAIRSETNVIPIPAAQAKQAVEVGQLKVVPPPTSSDIASLGLNQLLTTPIRILSPGSLAPQAVIVPTFTTSCHLISPSKPIDSIHAVSMQQKKRVLKPLTEKPVPGQKAIRDHVLQTGERGITQLEKSGMKIRMSRKVISSSTATTCAVTPRPLLTTTSGEADSAKRHQQYTFSAGKNIKHAKIYQEMLTKEKLCQLFKCMAVECSFTCNVENVFTQHIGLHEAQQRIKGKRKQPSKGEAIFNWKQCAYCCEVLAHTGSALSQHILSEHGHCLYQCAYCFYRAVSKTYVDLHQETVHDKLLKEKKRKIYKCKPVPGAVKSRHFEKQAKTHNVRPYQCDHCGSKFFIIQHFIDHLNKEHQSVTAYCCHICKNLCFKADRLIAHYKLHSFSKYQCAYCLHGAETLKEMLFHLCNIHFSQPPLICVRALEDPSKTDNVALDDLKVLTFDNELTDTNHILEEAESEVEKDSESKNAEPTPISVDLSAIVSELGIDVEDEPRGSSSSLKTDGDLSKALSVESMLPNAQFSSEADNPDENSSVLISSGLRTVISPESREAKDVSVPIGQLPIEVLRLQRKDTTDPTAKPEVEPKMGVQDIIFNLQQNNIAVTLSPVVPSVENKSTEETPTRGMHKLPPTVTATRSKMYRPKKIAIIKKPEDAMREATPILFQQLSNTPGVGAPQGVILAVPVLGTSKTTVQKTDDTTVLPSIQNVVSLNKSGGNFESSSGLESTDNASVVNRIPLIGSSENNSEGKGSLPKIADVRSLHVEKKIDEDQTINNIVLQPPIIRVEDFPSVGKNLNPDEKPKEPGTLVMSAVEGPSNTSPDSPDVIILEPEDEPKNSAELIEVVDSEDDEMKKDFHGEKEKASIESGVDLDIRKQMEQLRNQIQNETDCLLLDDASQGKDLTPNAKENSEPIKEKESESIASDNLDVEGDFNESFEKGDEDFQPDDDEKKSKSDEATTLPREKGVELTGKDLYLCGNEKCNFAAENDVDLKEHLYICDFSRESSVLVCPHCSKQLKQSVPYVEHLKLHGEKRFSCGLCNFSSALGTNITRHLKLKHKCSQPMFFPNDVVKPGYFVIYPKNHKKEKQDSAVNTYSPGDEDKLPLQAIYQVNVQCAKCPYFTKVRSNMVRHLKIHIKSVEAEGSIVVPSTAPTNPVPCLDTKEKMFDKMTNLAASSQMAQSKEKLEALTPEEEAKLPQFVPEQMRHKCCSPDCNYVTIDDSMLKHHIRALHDEINAYSCPHCRETVHVEFRYVPLEKIGQHLKYHDTKLYRCCHCVYFHYQKHVVEKHAFEKHPERRFLVYTVREPKAESASEEEHPAPSEAVIKAWKCGLCENFESTVRLTVLEHLSKVHSTKSKFKCKYCDMKSSQYQAFVNHFASKHNGQKVECIRALVQVVRSCDGKQKQPQDSSNHFDTTPLWQRDAPRIRHIRGILIEEEEIKTKRTKRVSSDVKSEVSTPASFPPDAFYCPLCTEKKKVFQSKNAESFRNHLYQELNYQQFACILCGKMFFDKRDFDRHHLKVHPNKMQAMKQTKEDSEIKFWVDKVISKQENQILERKRRLSLEESSQPSKRKKVQAGASGQKHNNVKTESGRQTRSSAPEEPKSNTKKKPDIIRPMRSVGKGAYQKDQIHRECPHCKFKGSDLNCLKTHIKLSHLRMGKWLCSCCGESFQLEKIAAKHCRSLHAEKFCQAIPNPDAEKEELTEEFWMEEYGFGKGGEVIKKELVKGPEVTKSDVDVYSCGYCNIDTKDQKSILDHFESHHKKTECSDQSGVVGTVYYQCHVCGEKMTDFVELSSHAKSNHPRMTLQFDIRKVYKYDNRCSKCNFQSCVCPKANQMALADDNCYQCPQCATISSSYLDCIDHFNEHFPRYACGACNLRFFSEEEISKHQIAFDHKSPYAMTIPSEKMLDDYKSGVKVKREGAWVSLQKSKRSDTPENAPESKKLKVMTARKSTTQAPDRKTQVDSGFVEEGADAL